MPRNVLAIPAKTSSLSSSNLSQALRRHIQEHFTDTHPDAFADDLRTIGKLREGMAHIDVHVASLDAVQRYHSQLVFMGTKFPSDVDVAFPWSMAFPPVLPLFSLGMSLGADDGANGSEAGPSSVSARPYSKATSQGQVVAHPDLRYERAAVLFCLAALYSSIGANETRSEGESLKRAIAAFQSAAGVLQYILTDLAPALSTLWSGQQSRFVDADLQPAMLSALRDAMLAQAQECFWQKAVVDRLKDATIARLATRVSELYEHALDFAQTGGSLEPSEDGTPRGCELPKDWINHMTIKRWHFAAAAQFRKSIDDLASNRYGDELARLKMAAQYVRKALDSSRSGTSDALQSDLKSLQGIIQANLVRANKDNDLIYLHPITAASSLAAISSAAMVDAKVPPEVSSPIKYLRDSPPPAFGRPLFQELVPYGVHVAISIFDDRRDSFVREEIELKREELDSLATSTLQSLDLPGSLQALEQPEGLPAMLVRKCEEVRSEGGLRRLQALSADVQRIANTARSLYSQAAGLAKQLPFVQGAGVNDDTPAQLVERNAAQSRALASQVEEYGATVQQAGRSDALVQEKVKEWQEVIEVLGKGEDALEAYVPGQRRTKSMDRGQSEAVRLLRVALEDLDDLMDNRTAVVEEAKGIARRHDIRPEIMREAGVLASGNGSTSAPAPLVIEAAHFEPLFDRELQRYDKLRAEMQASEKRQEACLDTITLRNRDFVQARSVDATMQKRQDALQRLDIGHAKYREISANLLEGLNFYNGLTRMLSDLCTSITQWTQQCHAEQADYVSRAQQERMRLQQQPSSPSAVAKPKARRSTKASSTHSRERSSDTGPSARSTRSHDSAPRQQPAQPSWGAWQGGDIRFAD